MGQCLGVGYPDWFAVADCHNCFKSVGIEGRQRLVGDVTEMRGDGDVGHRAERMIGERRFYIKDVDPGAHPPSRKVKVANDGDHQSPRKFRSRIEDGYSNVRDYRGGMGDWVGAGEPTERLAETASESRAACAEMTNPSKTAWECSHPRILEANLDSAQERVYMALVSGAPWRREAGASW